MKWQPIASAPQDRYILITPGRPYIPDVVMWRQEQPREFKHGVWFMEVKAGWFCLNGTRSRLDSHDYSDLFWCEIPPFDYNGNDDEPVSARRLHVA